MQSKRIDRRRWRGRLARATAGGTPAPHFQGSGLTRKAFARRQGVGASTLGKWLTDAGATSRRPSTVVFREMPWAGMASAAAVPWVIEVEGVGGLTVRCREALSLEDLIRPLHGPSC